MIGEYFRPKTVEEALLLLTEKGKIRKPLGGGTSLSRQVSRHFDVVDLQNVGLDRIEESGQNLVAGSTLRFDLLLAHPGVHPEIKRAIRIDASENNRNMATLGGWMVNSDGRSLTTTALLAMDANLTWEPEAVQIRLGDWLPLRSQNQPGVLMTEVAWTTGARLVFEYVARSPKDRPTMIVAMAQWGSGRTRVALGGFGDAPIIAVDGIGADGVDIASRYACLEAGDQWASAEYRREVAAKLALRCAVRVDAIKGSDA